MDRKIILILALVTLLSLIASAPTLATRYEVDSLPPPEARPDSPDGPGHSNELVELQTAENSVNLIPAIRVLINTSGTGPLTGISPIAEKNYWLSLMSGNPNLTVYWYDGVPTFALLSSFDLVIYDAGGYWYPLSQSVGPLWDYHFSGKPLIVVAPDINFDWNNVANSIKPTFMRNALHIGGVRGILPSSAFSIYANTGHPIINSMSTNTTLSVISNSSWPDSFDPCTGGQGVLRQGVAAIEFDRGTVAANPSAYSFGIYGNLYSVVAYPGGSGEGRVVTYGFPPTAIQESSLLRQLAENSINYALQAVVIVKKVSLDRLVIDDAYTNALINKAPGTKVDLVVNIINSEPLPQTMGITVSVPSNWTQDSCSWRLDTSAETGQSVACQDLGSGKHKMTLTFTGNRQAVFRFTIPANQAGMSIMVSADLSLASGVSFITHKNAFLSITPNAPAMIVTNRKRLYDLYDHAQVNALLTYLTEVAVGDNTGEQSSIIYYADWYDNSISGWNNTQVQYPVPVDTATTNAVADKLDGLIAPWATNQNAKFLMIVGGDEVLPLYRVWDGDLSNSEKDVNNPPPKYLGNAPAFVAIRNNFFFSDAPYSDIKNNDWLKGEVELATGRIVGNTASDITATIRNGILGPASSGRGVISSTGTCLNILPFNYVRACFDLDRIQSMYNQRSITYNSTMIENWSWNLDALTNDINNGPFSIFVNGGHADYDKFYCPGDQCGYEEFFTNRVINLTTPISANRPLIAIGGCHGGLVVDADQIPMETDNNVIAWLKKGASAVVGSTGFVAGNLGCGNYPDGEGWFNDYFYQLGSTWTLIPPQYRTRSYGEAVMLASKNFSGWPWFGHSKKATTEFILYGVPWTKPYFPSNSLLSTPANITDTTGSSIELGKTDQAGNGIASSYIKSALFSVSSYEIMAIPDYPEYELVTIPNTELQYNDLKPILPVMKAVIELPPDATIDNLIWVNGTSSELGLHNIPSASNGPVSQPGEPYTDTTDVSGLYPLINFGYDLTHFSDHLEVILYFYPVQHNPQTNETRLWTQAELQVQYSFTNPVVITTAATDKQDYGSGETINNILNVNNAGVDNLTGLVARSDFYDLQGNYLGSESSAAFDLAAGEKRDVGFPFIGYLAGGTYLVQYHVTDPGQIFNSNSSQYVTILEGQIVDFTVPEYIYQPPGGMDIPFTVDFKNYKSTNVNAVVTITIYRSSGEKQATLLSLPVTVPAYSQNSITVYWNSIGKPYDPAYQTVATVSTEDAIYGPVTRYFKFDGPSFYMPCILH